MAIPLGRSQALAATLPVPAFAAPSVDPFGLGDVGSFATPILVDIDGDGDLDLFAGTGIAGLQFFQNTGNTINPAFAPAITDPFGLAASGAYSAPTFVDIDGDGDLDLLVSNATATVKLFSNTGTATSPAFGTPDSLSVPSPRFRLQFVDFDHDGDRDFTGGDSNGNVAFLENTGTVNAPAFAENPSNPPGLVDVGDLASPTFFDIDGDGDLDLVVGNALGDLVYFENTGDAVTPTFASPSTGAFGLANTGTYAAPAFADIDGDGDLDAFIGRSDGEIVFFESTQGAQPAPVFLPRTDNPFGLISLQKNANPALADIESDGDLDVFIGTTTGNETFFTNTGSATNPAVGAPTSNPFGLADVGNASAPSFVDIDGDGDLDAFVPNSLGDTQFFRNTGSASSPGFASPTSNPFGLANPGFAATPAFADIDDDGDLDLFVGTLDGNAAFFQNTGSRSSPAFATATINPFGLTPLGTFHINKPSFVDIEGDGDWDAVLGNDQGDFLVFQNTGTAKVPAFASPSTNPFGLANVGYVGATRPTFVDVDGDGDLDLVAGRYDGATALFRNATKQLLLEDGFESGDTAAWSSVSP